MSRRRPAHAFAEQRFPRVSGDEPVLGRQTVAQIVFSPRERG